MLLQHRGMLLAGAVGRGSAREDRQHYAVFEEGVEVLWAWDQGDMESD